MTNEERPSREANFVSWLEGFVEREERAALANLRRGLGKSFAEAPEIFPYVMPFAKSYAEEENFGLIAPLFALHQGSWHGEADGRHKRNLGASLHWFANESKAEESTEKRFVALLNANREDLPEHLRLIVSLLKSKDIPIDWQGLLVDVRNWNSEKRFVQRNWARSFWRGTDDKNQTLTSSDDEIENENTEEEN